ncbi:hypothetical protein FA13DRAFT_98804 [Coprinellus micaceus]|uniref:Uncharacterized protein n=1 Tax=Coprinellus micaceus TaxID=71717 RepID=A0A4Y7SIL3_COPMI|nr:hypothetical protein FA13DRAFT_98804 [Coprinellus micaceus]
MSRPGARKRRVLSNPLRCRLRAKRGVKVTVWRIINSLVLLTFGATKAVMVSRGNPVADSFDMVVGLVWALISFWCGLIEEESPSIAPWLFQADITEFVLSVLALLAVWAVSGLAFILIELAVRDITVDTTTAKGVLSLVIPSAFIGGGVYGAVEASASDPTLLR